MKITLIGMPGSGKSFIGKRLANTLGYEFIDIDKILEEEYKQPLSEILERLGEQAFLEKEEDAVFRSASKSNKVVISPGGSIIYSEKAMQYLKTNSIILYLEVPLAVLQERIGLASRGIVGLKTKTLADLGAERTPLYKRYAQATFDANQTREKVVNNIVKWIKTADPHASNSIQL